MGSPLIPYFQIVKGSRDLLFEFWDPSISRERLELAIKFKFGMRIDHQGH